MDDDYPYKAKERVTALVETLETLIKRDPEQEVRGLAIPVLEAALIDVKQSIPNDAVVLAMVDLFSADFIATDEPPRAADMLVVARQLDAAIGGWPMVVA